MIESRSVGLDAVPASFVRVYARHWRGRSDFARIGRQSTVRVPRDVEAAVASDSERSAAAVCRQRSNCPLSGETDRIGQKMAESTE